MSFTRLAVAAVIAVGLALPAAAYQSRVLFQQKHWRVELVAWDDGSSGCMASVGPSNENFSIWTFQDQSVKLQFYSSNWDFGEGQYADLQVQVDRIAPWSLTDAELYKNSVLFNLPDSDDAVKFLLEIARGNRLYLRNNDGGAVQDYSLAGSKASMQALIDCGNSITTGNPFK